MKKRTTTGPKLRRPRRSAAAVIRYGKDRLTNYYTATQARPADAVPGLLPQRLYLDVPRGPKVAPNCQYVLTTRAGGAMLTGLRRRRGTAGPYRGNLLIYDPGQRKRVRRDLTAKIDGEELTLTLY